MQLRPEILLHPNIPKPLHGMAPRVVLGDEWWNKERKAAYARAGYCCSACGVPSAEALYHKWLEAHELYEMDYPNGKMIFKEVVALCHACHNFIHTGRMQALVDAGKMTRQKQQEILNHGNRILQKAGLRRPHPPKKCAPWGKWVMVLDGKEYKGQFASFDAWRRHYQ